MNIKKIDIKEIEKEFKVFGNKHFSYKLDILYRKYKELYFSTKFLNESLVFKNDNKIYIPITLDKNSKEYSFYGYPIEYFSENLMSKEDYYELKKYINKFNGKKFFKFKIENEKNIIENNLTLVESIVNEIYIDLSRSIEEIKNNFSSNLRNEMTKDYDDVIFEIIDKKNYKKNEIFEMMKLHIEISGKQTRSQKSWEQNENMILEDKGFLTKVSYKGIVVSYSFFCHNNFTCIYLSSAGRREYYKKIRNMHHKSLWMAINYAKKKCKFFFIGALTLYSKKILSEKEKSIEKFKSKFKGINSKFVILNDLPDYNYYKKYIVNTKNT
tara:strand:- start:8079 stop:9056 length:978 start_codon:yes stop_codon:yes gene_type:complete